MRFLRPYVVTAILSVAALLSACGSGDTSPTPSATVTVSPSVTVTGSPTASAPAMPEAAKAHTKEGAEAFVRHFWEVANHAQAMGETGRLSDLSADGCKSCDRGIRALRDAFAEGATYDGGDATVLATNGEILQADEQRFARVLVKLRVEKLTVRFADGRHPVQKGVRKQTHIFDLFAVPGGWLVGQFEAQ